MRQTDDSWRDSWSDRRFRRITYLSVGVFLATMALLRRVLEAVETRPGVELPDPLLASLPAIDSGWTTFTLIYGATLLAVASLLARPQRLLVALQAYTLLTNLRMLTLYLAPLDGPPNMIVLQDPVVETFLLSDHPVTRDLFFSGHTSTACLFFLVVRKGWIKTALLAAAPSIGLLLILQHVHYTVDVVAAPFFALGSYRLVRWAHGPERDPAVPRCGKRGR